MRSSSELPGVPWQPSTSVQIELSSFDQRVFNISRRRRLNPEALLRTEAWTAECISWVSHAGGFASLGTSAKPNRKYAMAPAGRNPEEPNKPGRKVFVVLSLSVCAGGGECRGEGSEAREGSGRQHERCI